MVAPLKPIKSCEGVVLHIGTEEQVSGVRELAPVGQVGQEIPSGFLLELRESIPSSRNCLNVRYFLNQKRTLTCPSHGVCVCTMNVPEHFQ